MRRGLSIGIAAALAIGCAPPAPDVSDALRGIEGTAWLVRRVSFPLVTRVSGTRSIAAGYDLDGVDTATPRATSCADRYADYVSGRHPSLAGIDNVGVELIPSAESLFAFTFADELARAVMERRLRWAIRVGELIGADATLPVELVALASDPAIALDAGGRPTADQRLRGAVVTAGRVAPEGPSAAGPLRADGLPVDGHVTMLPFADLRLGGIVLDASAAEGGVLLADLGGSFSVEGLLDETMRVAMDPDGDFTVARAAYESVADLEPSAEIGRAHV